MHPCWCSVSDLPNTDEDRSLTSESATALYGLRAFRRSELPVIRILGWWGTIASITVLIIAAAIPPERMKFVLPVIASTAAIFLGLGLKDRFEGKTTVRSLRDRYLDLYFLVSMGVTAISGFAIALVVVYFILPMGDLQSVIGAYALLSGAISIISVVRYRMILEYLRDLRARNQISQHHDKGGGRITLASAFVSFGVHFLLLIFGVLLSSISEFIGGEEWANNRFFLPSNSLTYAVCMFAYQFLLVGGLSRTSLLPKQGKTLVSIDYKLGKCESRNVTWKSSAIRAVFVVLPILVSWIFVLLLSIVYEMPDQEIFGLIIGLAIILYMFLAPASMIHPSRQGLHDIAAQTVPEEDHIGSRKPHVGKL